MSKKTDITFGVGKDSVTIEIQSTVTELRAIEMISADPPKGSIWLSRFTDPLVFPFHGFDADAIVNAMRAFKMSPTTIHMVDGEVYAAHCIMMGKMIVMVSVFLCMISNTETNHEQQVMDMLCTVLWMERTRTILI